MQFQIQQSETSHTSTSCAEDPPREPSTIKELLSREGTPTFPGMTEGEEVLVSPIEDTLGTLDKGGCTMGTTDVTETTTDGVLGSPATGVTGTGLEAMADTAGEEIPTEVTSDACSTESPAAATGILEGKPISGCDP